MTASPAIGSEPNATAGIPPERKVVAVVIEWRGRIALFKRSRHLGHESGLWHCISGFLEPGATPEEQALEEILEETGLQTKDLLALRPGPELVLIDLQGASWLVCTFTAVTTQRRLRLNWEHDSYRWTTPQKTSRFTNRVSWLQDVLAATGHISAILRFQSQNAYAVQDDKRGIHAGQ